MEERNEMINEASEVITETVGKGTIGKAIAIGTVVIGLGVGIYMSIKKLGPKAKKAHEKRMVSKLSKRGYIIGEPTDNDISDVEKDYPIK